MLNRRNLMLGAVAIAAVPSEASAENIENYKDMLLCNIPLRERGGMMRTCTLKFENYTAIVCPEFMDVLMDVYQMDIHDLAKSIHATWPQFKMISIGHRGSSEPYQTNDGGKLILAMVIK